MITSFRCLFSLLFLCPNFPKGSTTECLYTLQTFGIQPCLIPIDVVSGKKKNIDHLRWLELHKAKAYAIKSGFHFRFVDCPENVDILYGRGWLKMYHPGNAILRSKIEARFGEYNAIKSKRVKTLIAWSIVCEIRDSGARFLRELKNGWWVEVSNEEARKKVSIGFRDARKARQKALQSRVGNTTKTTNDCRKEKPLMEATKSPSSSDDPSSSVSPLLRRKSSTVDVVESSHYNSSAVSFLNLDGSKRQRCRACDDELWNDNSSSP